MSPQLNDSHSATAANPTKKSNEFLSEANRPATSMFGEIWTLLRYNKKWWITPIILVMLLVGVLVIMAGSSAAPLIYTLF